MDLTKIFKSCVHISSSRFIKIFQPVVSSTEQTSIFIIVSTTRPFTLTMIDLQIPFTAAYSLRLRISVLTAV